MANKAWLHFKKICIHKYWVAHYCFKCGLYWRGIKHDMSKFSPVDFWESVKYYQGNRSPIDAAKEDKGWSAAWMHHKGRNTHHYEYWQDNFDNGGNPLIMPFEDSVEMLCDYLAAGRAYMGKNFSFTSEWKWWAAKNNKPLAMHEVNNAFISRVLHKLWTIETNGMLQTVDRVLDEIGLRIIYEDCKNAYNKRQANN